MAASIVVHGFMAAVKMRIGRRAGSAALTADAWHDLVDLFSGFVALVAVLLSVFFSGMQAADHYGGFAIGLIVIFLGLRVARETTLQLMDTMPDDRQMQQIRAVAFASPRSIGHRKMLRAQDRAALPRGPAPGSGPPSQPCSNRTGLRTKYNCGSRPTWTGWRTCSCTWSRIWPFVQPTGPGG